MLPKKRSILRTLLAAVSVLGLAPAIALPVLGQTPAAVQPTIMPVANRLTQPIDEKALVTLKNTVHPLANVANDRGMAPDGMGLDRIQIVLKRSAAQEAALTQLIQDMHNPGTASYHKWLTPDQFGQQFGPSDADIATLSSWLQGHGFGNVKVNPGRQTIEVSGSAGQFRSTFHTQIHKYTVKGETHYANATEPQIPAALTPVVAGFASLNNFRARSHARKLGTATLDTATHVAKPQWTVGDSSGVSFVLAPGDFAVQYDLGPLYTAGTNGTNQSIAIINDANINVGLVNNFRTLFSLPANAPQVIIDGNDPGIDGINDPDGPNYDSVEAYLDVEWAGAVAPQATIDLVIGADTALQSGLALAAEHAVYSNIAPILSLSFGECEADLGSSNQFYSALWEQAAAQGQTVMVSTGDSGSAGCDNPDTQAYAVGGQAVSGFASTPYNVAVGGTDFYYSSASAVGTYWANNGSTFTTSNSSPVTSLLSRIPEQPWNDSQFGLDQAPYYSLAGTTTIAGGSGGASTAGYPGTLGQVPYPKPTWQTGAGVPADKARDIPDVALFAADGLNYSYYPICAVDGDCQPVSGGSEVQFSGVGGTSASTPAFAGMMALVNQKYGRQGQADFVLYPMATQFPAVFHDVTVGTNSVPCNITNTQSGLAPLDCIAVTSPLTASDSTNGSATEGQIGVTTTKTPEYNAGTGYDLASGLGTIDANAMVTNWGNVSFLPSTLTLTPSETSFAHGTAITISGAVAGTGGTTPTGSVALMTTSTDPLQQGQGIFPLSSGSYSNTVNYLPGGTYQIYGQYSGDGVNGASTSGKTQITVTPEASSLYFNALNSATSATSSTAIGSGASVPYGTQLLLSGQAVPTTYYTQCLNVATQPASCSTASYSYPTGSVTFLDKGAAINMAPVNAEGDAEFNAPLAIGSHSLTASYSGDNSYNASTASAITVTVTQNTPVIAVSSPTSTSATSGVLTLTTGQTNTLTVQVENSANLSNLSTYGVGGFSPVAPPTGTVTVTGLPGGTQTVTLQSGLDTGTTFVEGVGTLPLPSTLATGTYNLTVTYGGNTNYTTVSQAVSVVVAGAVSGVATSTTVTQSANATSPSASVTLTATVTAASGSTSPAGYVEFTVAQGGSTGVLGVVGLTASTTTASTATFQVNTSNLSPGSNPITVVYVPTSGSGFVGSSTLVNVTDGSAPGTPTFALSAPQVSVATPGGTGTATVTVTPYYGFTGAVSLTCAVTASTSGTASGITCPGTQTATISGTGSAASTFTVNTTGATAPGTYALTITGTSGSLSQTTSVAVLVGAGAGFSLSGTPPNPVSIVPGGTATSTITALASGGFTGTVPLTCAVTPASPNVTCALAAPSAVTLSGATPVTDVLTITTASGASTGSYVATVTGTLNGISASANVAFAVASTSSTPSFSLSAPALTIASQGATTGNTATVTVTPTGGFAGSVALTCAVAPTTSTTGGTDVPTCSVVSPVSITGTTAGTATLTVNTTAQTVTTSKLEHPGSWIFKGLSAAGGGVAMATLLFCGMPSRRRNWKTLFGLMVFVAGGLIAGSAMTGCGSGGVTAPTTTSSGGTTTGNYVVTVTGTSGSTSAFTTVSVTVN